MPQASSLSVGVRSAVARLKHLYADCVSSLEPIRRDHPLARHSVLGKPRLNRRLSHGGRYRPVMLICETVKICNNDCIICPYSRHGRDKHVMTMEVFDRVIAEYASIGGGFLSLTPMVGEVFLDRFLSERIERATACPVIRGVSITTNATHADRFAPAELATMVRKLCKVQISIYGIDAEEHRALTRRDDHDRVVRSVKALIDACDRPEKLSLAVRVLRPRDDREVREWGRATFGDTIAVSSATARYSNWGGFFDVGTHLPMGAEWLPARDNTRQCLIPIVAYQVFVNGDVSFCPCCDHAAHSDFALGNIGRQSLAEICNAPRVRELWSETEGGNLPEPCRTCTFHVPVETVEDHAYVFQEPLRFIGG